MTKNKKQCNLTRICLEKWHVVKRTLPTRVTRNHRITRRVKVGTSLYMEKFVLGNRLYQCSQNRFVITWHPLLHNIIYEYSSCEWSHKWDAWRDDALSYTNISMLIRPQASWGPVLMLITQVWREYKTYAEL